MAVWMEDTLIDSFIFPSIHTYVFQKCARRKQRYYEGIICCQLSLIWTFL